MHQEYLDPTGLYQPYGHPHGFVTMTCNHNWHEIQENLKDGETALDRPDLVACVFKLKKQQLIRDLGIEMLFGKMIARTHSIEFAEEMVSSYAYYILVGRRKSYDSQRVGPIYLCRTS